jgi:hypothetical protein
MRTSKNMRLVLLSLVGILHLGTGGILAQQTKQTTTTSKPPRAAAGREALRAAAPAAGAILACEKKVGILGDYFSADVGAFLVAHGLTVSFETGATIAGGSLSQLDVLYLNRGGVADASTERATIEAWVRGGGVLITEFDATELLFNGTFGFFAAAALVDPFGVPSGTVCGANTVTITSPSNELATGLPPTWTCSGDPIGVFKVYNEGTLDPAIDRVARITADQNQDGANDPVVGTACVDGGVVVPFFTDFGDWTALQDPLVCPNPPCNRSAQDEALLLNAVCRVKKNCELDHFLCYKVKPRAHFKKRSVLVRNQFGDQYFTVWKPKTLCVPSTKKERK